MGRTHYRRFTNCDVYLTKIPLLAEWKIDLKLEAVELAE